MCVPATCLMESRNLKPGSHEETIWFIVAPRMAETMILGLPWLKKWNLQQEEQQVAPEEEN